ncbi:hypothetical protein [Galbibacter sp. PAP.153]|uniref:hypothetical protein n=1 Tax=Galbibacter sp. PAP.153 TaxID=3104623 RepID=UPI0030080EDE
MGLGKSYNAEEDETLTNTQGKNEQFKSAKILDIRLIKPFQGIPADITKLQLLPTLNQAKDNKDRTRTLNLPAGKNSYFNRYGSTIVVSDTLRIIRDNLADGYRTDTAMTVLSREKGLAAGHSGSNVSTKGQSEAHNLLRSMVMDVLTDDDINRLGLKEREDVVSAIFSSVVVTSIAPAETVRYTFSNGATLKDKKGGEDYERNRNRLKERVDLQMDEIRSKNNKLIRKHVNKYLMSTQKDSMSSPLRSLDTERPHSPMRDEGENSGYFIQGGKYLTKKRKKTETLNPPKDRNLMGMYITGPFRAKRRRLNQ